MTGEFESDGPESDRGTESGQVRAVMRWLGFGVVVFVLTQFACVRVGVGQEGPARVVVSTVGQAIVGQPITIIVRFELEQEFVREQSIPLLQRAVDLPVQLLVPWTRNTVGAADPAFGFINGTGPSVAVADRIVRTFVAAPTTRGAKTFSSYEVRVTWTAAEEGTRSCTGTTLRYAFASGFEESLLGGRQPVDRQEGQVAAEPFELRAGGLPPGAPPGFSGAIGEFELAAAVSTTEIELGDEFELTMTVRGTGNLATFKPPTRPKIDGCVIQGMIERQAESARVFVFDALALRVGEARVQLELSTFSPHRQDWQLLRAEPVTITVKPRDPARALPARIQKLIERDAPAPEPDFPFWLVWTMGAILLLPATFVILMMRSRQREG